MSGRGPGGTEPLRRARAAARVLARDGVTGVVVDCERGMVRRTITGELEVVSARSAGARIVGGGRTRADRAAVPRARRRRAVAW